MKQGIWHIIAIIVVIIWGATFVSSKILIVRGMSPAEILVCRFTIAYLCLLPISIYKIFKNGGKISALFCDSVKDELLMAVLGITGGSLYFFFENTALQYTQASNVSIIITTTPLLTMLAANIFSPNKKRIGAKAYIFSAVALAGAAIVILNGKFVLKLNPLGDILTLCAAVTWVIYTLVLELFNGQYSTEFITRKVFFYGFLTMLPIFIFQPWGTSFKELIEPTILGNLLFLSILASFAGYYGWNIAVEKIGGVKANNYLYLNPLVTALLAVPILGEHFGWLAAAGSALIIAGMYFAMKSS